MMRLLNADFNTEILDANRFRGLVKTVCRRVTVDQYRRSISAQKAGIQNIEVTAPDKESLHLKVAIGDHADLRVLEVPPLSERPKGDADVRRANTSFLTGPPRTWGAIVGTTGVTTLAIGGQQVRTWLVEARLHLLGPKSQGEVDVKTWFAPRYSQTLQEVWDDDLVSGGVSGAGPIEGPRVHMLGKQLRRRLELDQHGIQVAVVQMTVEVLGKQGANPGATAGTRLLVQAEVHPIGVAVKPAALVSVRQALQVVRRLEGERLVLGVLVRPGGCAEVDVDTVELLPTLGGHVSQEPRGDVLGERVGGRVEGEQCVEVAMVQFTLEVLTDGGEFGVVRHETGRPQFGVGELDLDSEGVTVGSRGPVLGFGQIGAVVRRSEREAAVADAVAPLSQVAHRDSG